MVLELKLLKQTSLTQRPSNTTCQVTLAQKWVCSGEEPEVKLALRSEEHQLEGFVDTVKELWNKMKSMSKF